ncbi:unnamed protein product [Wuchereria bancrofti]|uniref:Uncharacterized protein n=2 Tax=Wuchereria bancrofti TaxID=6293 RepID=A0A3P7DLF4_WUCBA|nr:unnamed protein product [Wuchereria bancrofti]
MVCKFLNRFCFFVLFLLMTTLVETCDIEIRLKSDTEKPFQFHFSVESIKYWSDLIIVAGKTARKLDGSLSSYHIFHVKGSQCDEKNWHFYVWELVEGSNLSSPKWKITDHKKFKMESLPLELFKLQPHVYITVKDDLKMSIGPMLGVLWCQHC